MKKPSGSYNPDGFFFLCSIPDGKQGIQTVKNGFSQRTNAGFQSRTGNTSYFRLRVIAHCCCTVSWFQSQTGTTSYLDHEVLSVFFRSEKVFQSQSGITSYLDRTGGG